MMFNKISKLYPFTIFLSAFLLFSLEPLFAKYLLPAYGGQPTIWISLMTIYMGLVSLGYLYVHLLSKKPLQAQLHTHKLLSIVTIIFIIIHFIIWKSPILPLNYSDFLFSQTPALSIIFTALIHLGLPFFLLATTSTLLQSWQTHLKNTSSPYSLYTVSNLGSLIALLSYPFLIEPLLSIHTQSIIWSILFAGFIFFILKIIFGNTNALSKLSPTTHQLSSTSLPQQLLWLLLSALTTISLVATTSYLSQAISPTPFIWLIPLSLYLLSFIIAFSGLNWYSPPFHLSLLLSLFIISTLEYTGILHLSYFAMLSLTLSTMFLLSLIAHTRLYQAKPDSSALTKFYFLISLGSVIGSAFCSLVAPLIFSTYWEYPLSFLGGIILILYLFIKLNVPLIQKLQFIIFSILAFATIVSTLNPNLFNNYKVREYILTVQRNFFGVTTVKSETSQINSISHVIYSGKIMHGSQDSIEKQNPELTIYYTKGSGLGLSILTHPTRLSTPTQPIRVGIIGLGAGAIASYCNSGDYFHFYEINPQIIDISQSYFTYISHCRESGARVDITSGDGRLSLAKENGSNYDVLTIDAFTDDAIPVHLLTQEAIEIYLKHLAKTGLLVFHITNAHINLVPVLLHHAKTFSLSGKIVESDGGKWIILSQTPIPFGYEFDYSEPTILWTDDFSSIFSILK